MLLLKPLATKYIQFINICVTNAAQEEPPHAKYDVWLQLHGAIYRPDSFVMMLRYCANLKAIRYESTSLNRIVADKSHRVIVACVDHIR